MNRIMIPFCNECTVNYQITSGTQGKLELFGHRIPMLLQCGHDLCRKCISFYKKSRQIICKICSVVTNIEHEDHFNNIPVHYYLVGKVLYLSSNKKQNMFREMNNLRMTNLPGKPQKKDKRFCDKCLKHSDFFCQQCDEAYCKSCFKEIHQEGQVMYQHDVDKLENTEVFTESKCGQHLKLNEFFCLTCQLRMCSICAIDNHRQHDIQHLEKYNLSVAQTLTDYTRKGDILLKKFKYYKKEFNEKLQKYQNAYSKNKMRNDSNDIRQQIQTIFYSLIGFLQGSEIMFLNMLNQAELTDINSLNKIVYQFSYFIDDLQAKLNKVDLLMNNNQHSDPEMVNTIFDIDHIVKKTYYVGKKNNIKPSLFYDHSIYNDIQRCISLEYDFSDTYILTDSPELPQSFTLCTAIEVNSDEMALLKRSTSSISSISTISSSDFDLQNDVTNGQLKPLPRIQQGKLPIKEMKKNDVEPVIITHINSPSDFYLHLIANNSILTTITNELNNFIRTEHSVIHCIERNNVMYAVQRNEIEWQRGIVLNIQEDNSTTNYTFQCIDYGSTITVTADRVKGVPDTVVSISPLAFNCALYKIKPSLITGWSNEAYILFSDLILAKFGSYFVYPMNVEGEQIEVDVVWKEYLYPLSIRDAMFFLGHGSSESYINNDLHEKLLNTITLPEAITLEEGKEYNVILSHFNNPNDFYLRINDENNSVLMNVMQLLNSIYKPTEIDTHKSYLLYTPRIGMAVAARYTIDSHWYRAKIISLPEPRMVTVFYIDYGNSETLLWDQLRVLDKQLIEIPPLAIKSMLVDINPAEDGIECTVWSDKACADFMVLSDEVNPDDSKLSALIREIDSDVHKVVLYNHKSRGEFCINSKLISQGHATVLDPATCLFYKKNSRKSYPIKAPVHMNIRTSKMEKQSSDEDPSIFSRKKIVIDSEHMWETPNKMVPGTPMSVVKIVSPNEIILKHLNYDTTKLTECMNKMYNDKKRKKFKKYEWKINNLCAVFIKKFGNWYRGKIIKLNTENKDSSIYFYDINETFEEIPIKKIYVLEKSFVSTKCAFIQCYMDKILPLGTMDGKWPKFTCDRLIELLKHYPMVYFARKGRTDSTDFGEIWVKEIDKPKALDPLRERWININKYLIESGYAYCVKQPKDDEHNTTTQLKSELCTTSIISEHAKPVNGWLPHDPVTDTIFEAFPMYVDYHCHVYLHILDAVTSQMSKYVKARLNSLYADSQPEPTNYKWVIGQMVICKYFLDESWCRGTIIKKELNGDYLVQLLDYGNTESCSHENLRSNLHDLVDIPQLCIIGFFSTIKPLTKNEKWPIPVLDFIHKLVVEKPCTVTIDFAKSLDTIYAIKHMKNECEDDICQYLVSSKLAFFYYVNAGYIKLQDEVTPEINIPNESKSIESSHLTFDETTESEVSYQNFTEDSNSVQSFSYKTESNGDGSIHTVENNSVVQNSFYEVDTESDGDRSIHDASYDVENNSDVQNSFYEEETESDGDRSIPDASYNAENNSDVQNLFYEKETESDGDRSIHDASYDVENSSDVQNSFYEEETESDGDRSIPDASYNAENNSDVQNSFYEVETKNDGVRSIHVASYNVENNSDVQNSFYEVENINDLAYVENNNINNGVQNSLYKVENINDLAYIENDNMQSTSSKCEIIEDDSLHHSSDTDTIEIDESEEETEYLQFSLETNEVFEGTLCCVTGPTSMTLIISKVGGVNIKASKDELQKMMYEKCPNLPVLDNIIPGTAVAVLYQILWKRGRISNDGKSVYLVDFGISIKLIKKNLRLCPAEFLHFPTFSINCQLINVKPNILANAEDIVREMTKSLKDIDLKIIGISYLDDDIMGVELYNDKDEIAYQSLIDTQMLIVNHK